MTLFVEKPWQTWKMLRFLWGGGGRDPGSPDPNIFQVGAMARLGLVFKYANLKITQFAKNCVKKNLNFLLKSFLALLEIYCLCQHIVVCRVELLGKHYILAKTILKCYCRFISKRFFVTSTLNAGPDKIKYFMCLTMTYIHCLYSTWFVYLDMMIFILYR